MVNKERGLSFTLSKRSMNKQAKLRYKDIDYKVNCIPVVSPCPYHDRT